jgi:hypothetical protein
VAFTGTSGTVTAETDVEAMAGTGPSVGATRAGSVDCTSTIFFAVLLFLTLGGAARGAGAASPKIANAVEPRGAAHGQTLEVPRLWELVV